MILKNHTISSSSQIYQYDKKKKCQRKVQIKEICYKKYLYELKNEDRIITNTENLIENILGTYERKWDTIIQKIINNSNLYLEDEEVAYIYLLFIIQLLRVPSVINFTVEYFNATLKKDDQEMKTAILSLFHLNNSYENNKPFIAVANLLCSKSLTVFRTDETFILNGENPINVLSLCPNNLSSACFYFPISSHVCLALLDNMNKERHRIKNINIEKKIVSYLNQLAYEKSERFLYSSQPIKKFLHLK